MESKARLVFIIATSLNNPNVEAVSVNKKKKSGQAICNIRKTEHYSVLKMNKIITHVAWMILKDIVLSRISKVQKNMLFNFI